MSRPDADDDADGEARDAAAPVGKRQQPPYLRGFGNSFETISPSHPSSSLPSGRNNPLRAPCGLYAEQLSGTAFTSPRSENRRTWLYRTVPSVGGTSNLFRRCGGGNKENGGDEEEEEESSFPRHFGGESFEELRSDPNPLRWKPTPFPSRSEGKVNFIRGTRLLMGSGSPSTKDGIAIYTYCFNDDMRRGDDDDDDDDGTDVHMYNSDGDFLLVPQVGILSIQTELGRLVVEPCEIVVIPRGIVFSVNVLPDDPDDDDNRGGGPKAARGYILETYKNHFALPELGPIGSNGLANARDFEHPTAYVAPPSPRSDRTCVVVNKYAGELFRRTNPRSPYNVAAWHGNYVPFKYDLRKFCAMNSVTYDHPDPSIYTVLTVSDGESEPGTALADFVIFPPRMMATDDDTFRPPWYHRNTMSEYMGLIWGEYDAKRGFVPGGGSLHPTMTPHGPDSDTYEATIESDCSRPTKFDGGLAFMFETSRMLKLSRYALEGTERDFAYAECWDGLKDNFAAAAAQATTGGGGENSSGA